MTFLLDLLLILHLLGLVLALGSGMVLAYVTRLSTSPADSGFATLSGKVSQAGHMGLGFLWISGPLLLWLKYGGWDGISHWFWVKMVLVVVLSAALGMATARLRKVATGDGASLQKARIASMVAGFSGVAVVIAAVFTFH